MHDETPRLPSAAVNLDSTHATFLMDSDGIIRCWGERARLMKWWTTQQAEDGTGEPHLAAASTAATLWLPITAATAVPRRSEEQP